MSERIGVCDICKRLRPIVRTFDDLCYCTACYHRLFVRIACTHCGAGIRVPRQHIARPLLCTRCQNANRVCIRCGKPIPHVARITAEGPVCGSCGWRYVEPKPCAYCGTLSQRLSRCHRLGLTEPACPACQTRDNRTCSVCGKYRRVHLVTDKGRPVCERCAGDASTGFICPRCGQAGRRHSPTSCLTCYHRDLAERKLAQSCPLFSHKWAREAFTQFFNELRARRGDLAAATAHDRHLAFFLKLDANFTDPKKLNAESLVQAVDLLQLRLFDLPLNFLRREGLFAHIEQADLQHAAFNAAQQRVLRAADGHWYADLLTRYVTKLRQRQRRSQQRGWTGKHARFLPRTITNYLRTANSFLAWLERHDVNSIQGIEVQKLDAFLLEYPGLRDGLRPFVQYLNQHEKLFAKLSITTRTKNLPQDALLPDQQYHALLARWLSPGDDELEDAMIGLMMTLYCQNLKKAVSLEMSQFHQTSDGQFHVRLAKHAVPVPESVANVLTRYLEHRKSPSSLLRDVTSPYLFPGRNVNASLSPATASGRLHKRYGVSAEQLFSTGLFHAYRGGVQHPKILVTRFGISLITAMKYFELLSPRLKAEYERLTGN